MYVYAYHSFRVWNSSQTSDIFWALLVLTCTNSRLIWQMSEPKYNAAVHIFINIWSVLAKCQQILSYADIMSEHFSPYFMQFSLFQFILTNSSWLNIFFNFLFTNMAKPKVPTVTTYVNCFLYLILFSYLVYLFIRFQ